MAVIRAARLDEVDAILSLFAGEVRAGRMLPRRADEMRANLPDWLVAADDAVDAVGSGGRVVGCVSLVFFNRALCEVRSLYVDAAYRGNGVALALLDAAIDLARARGMRRVLTLTRAVHLFERAGFRRDAVANFPEKVWRDCTPCPLRHVCDETALVLTLSPHEET